MVHIFYINLYFLGSTQRSLTLKENVLTPGTWYLISLAMIASGEYYGPAYYEFVTNRPPQGGFCKVIPYDDITLIPKNTEVENTTTSTSMMQYDFLI